MYTRFFTIFAAMLLAATVAPSAQESLLREDGSLGDAETTTESGSPVVWHTLSVPERSRVQIEAASVDFEPVLLFEHAGSRQRRQRGYGGSVYGAAFLEPGEQLRVGIIADPAADAREPLRYSLRVDAGPAPDLLRAGESRGGTLTDEDERAADGAAIDWYPLRLDPGERVRLELQSVEFDAYLVIRSPDGSVLENDDVEGTDSALVYTAVEAGTAQVGASSFGPAERGAYQLNVEALEAPRELEVGSTVRGSLGTDGTYTDDYLLPGKEGQMVLVRLESADFDTVLRLRASDGFYAENDDEGMGSTDSELFYAFPEDGTAVLQAGSFSAEESGSYRISVLSFETEEDYPSYREGRRLEAGTGFDGLLSASAPSEEGRYYHDFTVEAREGRLLRLSLSSGMFDPYLVVTSPSGSVFEDDDSGGNGDAFVEIEAPESGTYRVRATTYGAGGLGVYTLGFEESRPREPVADFTGEIDPTGVTDEAGRPFAEHEYEAEAGETAVIQAESADFDTVLTVRDPQGNIVAENDDFGSGWNSRVELEFARTGTYTITVSAYWDDQSGAYRVTISE